MEQFFKYTERDSSLMQEIRAGFTTFLAMAYIIAVNPTLLSNVGISPSAAITATCVGAGLLSILMGLYSNRPLACAPGLGVAAIVAFTLVKLAGGSFDVAMAVVLLEGIGILILVLLGLREAVMDAIPVSLRHAIAIGLGIFIAFIGLRNGGVVVDNDSTLVAMGAINDPVFFIGVLSILLTVILDALHIEGAIFWGILISTVAGIPLGVTQLPTGIVSGLDFSTFGAPFKTDASGQMAIVKALFTPSLLVFAFSLMMSDFFDTMGTAMAVAKQGKFLKPDGHVENMREILVVDSSAAAIGGLIGASSITTFLESASGAADGGRTGLTSVVTGLLFILAAFFAPLFAIISTPATCGALVYVGYLMMSEVVEIDWSDPISGFPSFAIMVGVPLTYSISYGIGMGFISYIIVAVFAGRIKEIKPLMWIATAAFIIYFIVG